MSLVKTEAIRNTLCLCADHIRDGSDKIDRLLEGFLERL